MKNNTLTRSAALNGASLGAALGSDFGPALWDETQAAALALTNHEARRGFSWEAAPVDWESACARIADEIRAGASGKWPQFVAALLAPGFQLGDRVELMHPTKANSALRNGAVVLYHGKHDRTEPRVRWASGWGTSSPASDLRLMNAGERAALPAVKLCRGDAA